MNVYVSIVALMVVLLGIAVAVGMPITTSTSQASPCTAQSTRCPNTQDPKDHKNCYKSTPPQSGWSCYYSDEGCSRGNRDECIKADCEAQGKTYKGKYKRYSEATGISGHMNYHSFSGKCE